jgi:hypothetical protein
MPASEFVATETLLWSRFPLTAYTGRDAAEGQLGCNLQACMRGSFARKTGKQEKNTQKS